MASDRAVAPAPNPPLLLDRTVAGSLVLFLGVSLVMVLLRPPMPVVETRYLSVAWEMALTGDYLLPRLNGALYPEKPPLLFWLVNLAWGLSGGSDVAARLVGPVGGAATILLAAGLARALWPDQPARAGRTAVVLATTLAFLVYGAAVMFDALLAAFVVAAYWALWRLHRGAGLATAGLLGLAVAGGVLTKGPVMLLHLAPGALLYPVWAGRERRTMRTWLAAMGVALGTGALVSLAWLGPALFLADPGYREAVLWRQTAGRLVASFAHVQPVWFYLALLPALVWPWAWTRRGLAALHPRCVWRGATDRLIAVWALGTLVAFSTISGKQLHYLVPELPALALLLSGGDWGHQARRQRYVRLLLLIPASALIVVGGAVALGLWKPPEGSGLLLPPGHFIAALAVFAATMLAVLNLSSTVKAIALVAPGTMVTGLLIGAPSLNATYDASAVGNVLAVHAARGLALREHSYLGEFNHAGRLPVPIERLQTGAEEAEWIAGHPGGVLITHGVRDDPRLTQILLSRFRGGTYRLYRVDG